MVSVITTTQYLVIYTRFIKSAQILDAITCQCVHIFVKVRNELLPVIAVASAAQ